MNTAANIDRINNRISQLHLRSDNVKHNARNGRISADFAMHRIVRLNKAISIAIDIRRGMKGMPPRSERTY